jgi:hypothetical protein
VTQLKGAQFVQIRPIDSEVNQTEDMAGYCIPRKNKFIGGPMTRRVNTDAGQPGVRINSHANAYRVESVKLAGMELFKPDRWTAYA